jgi:hypothetical protein
MASRSRRCFPGYLVAPADAVAPGPWMRGEDGSAGPLEDFWPHWDYNSEVRARREIAINAPVIRSHCRIDEDRAIRAAVTWRSTATNLRGLACSVAVVGEQRAPVVLSLALPSSELGGDVLLHTQILVFPGSSAPSELSAVLPGSVLWDDETTFRVEGRSSRFPVELVSFSQSRLPAGASWFLHWDPRDLGAPVLAGLRLLVNADHPAVARAASSDGAIPGDREIQSAMRSDVMRRLILGALESEVFIAAPDSFEDGSVGRELRRLIRTTFGNEAVSSLAQRARNLPEEFNAELQDKSRLFC